MANATKMGTVKRLGARYGRKLRERVGIIETEQRKKHMCPNCRTENVKRVFSGVWQCRKCDHKFTSKAYTVEKAAAYKPVATNIDETPSGAKAYSESAQ